MPSAIIVLVVLGGGIALALFLARLSFVRTQSRKRLQAPMLGVQTPQDEDAPPVAPKIAEPAVESIFRRYRWVPWVLGVLAGLVVWFVLGYLKVTQSQVVQGMYSGTVALMVLVVSIQVESGMIERKKAKIDLQLAEALDQMISAIRAGASVVASMERAAEEAKNPLKAEFMSCLGLIRYGDAPSAVMRRLMLRVPLESFQLFCITMAVHFEVGGTLAPTLASVASVVRDKIEISGRIRSLTAQSRASTVTLVLLTYGIAAMMCFHDPDGVKEFAFNVVGGGFIAFSMAGEAIGFVWLSAMAKIK